MKKILLGILAIILPFPVFSQSSILDYIGLDTVTSHLIKDSTKIMPVKTKRKTVSPRVALKEIVPFIPTTYNIDKSKAVGEISYSISNDQTGALLVDVPIDLPPDPRGFTPEIKLSYNSHYGNGTLGYGWNISGLSTITAINKSVYYDGLTDGVLVRQGDVPYSLDGQRLIKIGNSPLSYQTERGNIKVNAEYEEGLLYSLTTLFPDGRIAEYGISRSGVKGDAYDDVTHYCKQITDINGNKIQYKYGRVGNNIRLEKVTYGLQQQYSINFSYTSNRQDPLLRFTGGEDYSINYLLNSIDITYNGNLLKSYHLIYSNQNGSSVISQIECSAQGVSLNPLV